MVSKEWKSEVHSGMVDVVRRGDKSETEIISETAEKEMTHYMRQDTTNSPVKDSLLHSVRESTGSFNEKDQQKMPIVPSTLAYLEFVRKRENEAVREKESLKTKEVTFQG